MNLNRKKGLIINVLVVIVATLIVFVMNQKIDRLEKRCEDLSVHLDSLEFELVRIEDSLGY